MPHAEPDMPNEGGDGANPDIGTLLPYTAELHPAELHGNDAIRGAGLANGGEGGAHQVIGELLPYAANTAPR